MNKGRMGLSFGKPRLLCGAAAFCALLFGGTRANAQAVFQPFSADQVPTVLKKTTTGKVYATEKAMRIESEEKGKKSISIMRFDRKVMWVVMPEQKMYMEMGGFSTPDIAAFQKGAKMQRESLGTEQVGSYHCDKYRVRATLEGKEYVSLEWDAKELNGFPVKRVDEKGHWSTEYQNVRLGAQDPSLFEIPSGYQKISIPGMSPPQQ